METVIVVVADTHRETGHGLDGAVKDGVERADRVVHAGDFTTVEVLTAFQASGPPVVGVAGNRDEDGVMDRLPEEQTFTVGDVVVALTHQHESGTTGLALFGRSHGADLVISGHTHRPHLIETEAVTLLNPGSHTQPRGGPPTHAELRPTTDGLRVQVLTRDGTIATEGIVD